MNEPVQATVTTARSGIASFIMNSALSLFTVGLLWYLRASGLVCTTGGSCTITALFGEGLHLLIPPMSIRLLADLPLGLLRLPFSRLAERKNWQFWYELALSAYDSLFLGWMLLLGPGRFLYLPYLDVLGAPPALAAMIPLLFYATIGGLLLWVLLVMVKQTKKLRGAKSQET